MSESKTPSMAGFEIWFLQNYPADCILANPAWHLPKIYRAAIYEWEKALAAKTAALEDCRKALRYLVNACADAHSGYISGSSDDEEWDIRLAEALSEATSAMMKEQSHE